MGTGTDILVGTDIPAVAATPVAGAIQVDVPIPVDVVITVEEVTPVDVDTTVDVVTTAVAASGSTERLTGTGMAPATTSRTIATLTAITISGATGIRQLPVATPRHTGHTAGTDITGA